MKETRTRNTDANKEQSPSVPHHLLIHQLTPKGWEPTTFMPFLILQDTQLWHNITPTILNKQTHTHTTILRPFFRDHPGEPVPEENFWTSWCKVRLTEADKPIIRLGATPSRLTSAYIHHPPICFTGRMPFLPPNQQHQSTEGN